MNARTSLHGLYAFAVLLCAAAVLIGCSGSKTTLVVPPPNQPIGLPVPSAAGPVNTYSGVQSPGVWNFTLDDTKNQFNYQAVTYPQAPVTGGMQAKAGFLLFGNGGMAYEVQGRAAVLRPGDSTAAPVFGVPQAACYAIAGRLRFQYIPMFPGVEDSGNLDTFNGAPFLGYGSVVASTDATGAHWQFENLQGSTWTPSEGTPGILVSGPDSFTGACNSASGAASISISSTSILDTFETPAGATLGSTAKGSIWVGPSGFFAADQSDPTQSTPTGASVAGVVEPSQPLSTSDVVSGKYLGVLYEAANQTNYGNSTASPAPASTEPVAFGQVVAGSAGMMTGGIFPTGDVTATPNTDIQIALGSQDGTLNGLYRSVSITVPDPAQNCANFVFFSLSGVVSSGVNAQGYTTCTFPGVAIVGNPEGKYAIFINSYDWAVQYGGAPMQLYLFQQ